MKFNLTKEEMHDHLKVKKAALISIAINVLEIVAGIVMLTLVRRMLIGGRRASCGWCRCCASPSSAGAR